MNQSKPSSKTLSLIALAILLVPVFPLSVRASRACPGNRMVSFETKNICLWQLKQRDGFLNFLRRISIRLARVMVDGFFTQSRPDLRRGYRVGQRCALAQTKDVTRI